MFKKLSKKKKILFLIITGVLLTSVSVFATYLIESRNVEFDNPNNELLDSEGNPVTDVQTAIDVLLDRCENSGGKEYTITFNSMGGSSVSSETSSVAVLANSPTRAGYVFTGWYTEGGDKVERGTSLTADTTLYAGWEAIPTGATTGVLKPDGYVYYDTAVEVLYNPKEKSKCDTNGGSTAGKMYDCMKWYAYSSKDGVVNMILDHNIANGIKWYDSSSSNNQLGPQTALSSLKNLTDNADWKTTVQGDYATYTGNVTAQNINYSGYKARLITAQEIAYIVGNDSWNEKSSTNLFYFGSLNTTGYSSQSAGQKFRQQKNGWLFDNLYYCRSYGCSNSSSVESGNYGYWTSSPLAGNTYRAWYVDLYGYLNSRYADDPIYGVRPVITVSTSDVFS